MTLSGNLFFINQVPFFATISDCMKFTSTEHQARSQPQNPTTLGSVQTRAATSPACFTCFSKIKHVPMDGKFVPMKHELASAGVILSAASTNERKPKTEQQICVIKERALATRRAFSFKVISLTVLMELICSPVPRINAFPPKGGASPTLSLRNVMTGAQFDHSKRCKLQLGSRIQAHQEPSPTNAQAARTV